MTAKNTYSIDAVVHAVTAELDKCTESLDTLDTSVVVTAVLSELEKTAESTGTIDNSLVEGAIKLAIEEKAKALKVEKAAKIEIEKRAEIAKWVDADGSMRKNLDDAQYLKFLESMENIAKDISEFYDPGVVNRDLENTSFSELTSILDNFTAPVGEYFTDAAIAHSPLEDRQDICEFLGIRESTLSGWIKDERVPRMAQVALLFLMSFEGLKRQTKVQRIKMMTTLPVQIGNSWGVMKMDESDNGSPKGVVIAEGISSFEQAAQLAKAPLAISQLRECLMLLGSNSMSDAYTLFYDDVEHPKESELYREITATVLKGDKGTEKWIREITEEAE